MTKEKITSSEVLKYIKDIEKIRKFKISPTQLAFVYQVSVQTIYRKLKELASMGKVELVKKNKYIVDYKVIKKI